MVTYALVVTEKFKKGTDVRVIATGTQEWVEQKSSEIKWAGKRGQPHIIPATEIESFTQAHRTGIFVPTYDPVAAAEEEAAKIRRQKEQEKFEREREAATSDIITEDKTAEEIQAQIEAKEIAIQLRATKYGIIADDKEIEDIEQAKLELKKLEEELTTEEEPTTEEPTTREQFAASLYERMGYATALTGGILTATKPQEQIVISRGVPLVAKGEVTDPTALKFYPGFIGELKKEPKKIKGIIKEFPKTKMQKIAESIEEQERKLAEKYKYIGDIFKYSLPTTPMGLPIKEGFFTGVKKELGIAAYGITAGLIEEGVIATQKGIFFTAALFQKDYKEAAKKELFRAGTRLLPTLKEQYAEAEIFKPTPKGVVGTGLLFGLPLIPAVPKFFKKARAKTVLKTIAKEPPPDIMGRPYYKPEIIKYGLEAEAIIKTPKTYVRKPSGIVTSKYEVSIPKPTVTVAESISGKSKYRYVTTPDKIQYVTIVTKKTGKTYYVRSRVSPTGETITTVFRGDIPLQTFRYKAKPTLKLLEPLEKIGRKEYISVPELRREVDTRITTAGMVSLLKKGKYEVKGLRIRGTRDILTTKTVVPRTEFLGTPVIDLLAGKKSIKPISIKIGETRYRYVDYTPKQKPFVVATGDFGVFLKRPTISKTIQATKVREEFLIKFIKVKKPTITDMFKSKRGELITKPIVQEIRRPLLKPKLKGAIDLYFPTVELKFPVSTATLPIVLAAGIPKTKAILEPKAKLELIPKTEAILGLEPKSKVELLPKSKIEILPKTEVTLRQEILQEQLLEQQPITQLTTKQKLTPLETSIDILRPVTRVPPPPPPIIFGLPRSKAKFLIAATLKEQGYDVLIKRKQLKKGRGSYESRGYRKANTVPLTKEAALGLGASIVDTYTNRSYKIKKTNEIAVKRAELRQKWAALKGKFRRSKTKQNIIIEKTKYAIDSATEKRGIPYEAKRLRMLGLLNTKKKNIVALKKSNSFLNLKKKRKGGTKWL